MSAPCRCPPRPSEQQRIAQLCGRARLLGSCDDAVSPDALGATWRKASQTSRQAHAAGHALAAAAAQVRAHPVPAKSRARQEACHNSRVVRGPRGTGTVASHPGVTSSLGLIPDVSRRESAPALQCMCACGTHLCLATLDGTQCTGPRPPQVQKAPTSAEVCGDTRRARAPLASGSDLVSLRSASCFTLRTVNAMATVSRPKSAMTWRSCARSAPFWTACERTDDSQAAGRQLGAYHAVPRGAGAGACRLRRGRSTAVRRRSRCLRGRLRRAELGGHCVPVPRHAVRFCAVLLVRPASGAETASKLASDPGFARQLALFTSWPPRLAPRSVARSRRRAVRVGGDVALWVESGQPHWVFVLP